MRDICGCGGCLRSISLSTFGVLNLPHQELPGRLAWDPLGMRASQRLRWHLREGNEAGTHVGDTSIAARAQTYGADNGSSEMDMSGGRRQEGTPGC